MSVVFTGKFLQLEPVCGGWCTLHGRLIWTMVLWLDKLFCWAVWWPSIQRQEIYETTEKIEIRDSNKHRLRVDALDKRVTGCPYSGLQTCDIPDGTQIACHLNRDRSAMNSLVFAEHLKNTHSTFEFTPPPSHTQEAIYDGVIVGGIYLLLQDMICLTDAVIVMYRQHLGKNLEIHSLNCSIVYLWC
jgi:hypothetical protein